MSHEELVNKVHSLDRIVERLNEQNTDILLAAVGLKGKIKNLEGRIEDLEYTIRNMRGT